MSREPRLEPEAASDLSRLLEREAQLEAMLEQARERAALLLHEAEVRCEARRAALDAELRDASEAARQRHACECAVRLAALERETEAVLGRYRQAAAERSDSLVDWVVGRVLQDVNRGAGA